MSRLCHDHRSKRTNPIKSTSEVKWEIVYGEDSEQSQRALDEVHRIIYEHAVTNGFFKKAEKIIEKQNTSREITAPAFLSPVTV